MTRPIQPMPATELPPAVRLGMEFKRRGLQAPAPIQALTAEYERRGFTGPSRAQHNISEPFTMRQGQVDVRAADQLERMRDQQPHTVTGEDRQKFIDNQMGQWLEQVEQTAMAGPTFQRQTDLDPLGRLGVHLGAIQPRMTYQQRQDLYASIGPEQFDKKREELGEQFDRENSPEARYLRDRDEYGNLLAQQYRSAHPDARDSDVYNYMHRQLARYGYNPSNAGEIGTVIDRHQLNQELAQIQQATDPLVDRAPGILQPAIAAGTGAVKSFQDSLATFVGTIGAGGISEFLERTIGDDLGMREQQAAIQDYWSRQAGENRLLGTSRDPGMMGKVNRFAETMGGVAGDLAQTLVASSVGGGGAKLAGLNGRLARLSTQLGGMGFMGAKEGGGAYRTVYDQLVSKGYSHQEANQRALYAGISVGVVNALLEKAPIDAFVLANPQTINRLKGALRGTVIEGSQEAAQEMVGVLAEFEAGGATGPVVSWENTKRVITAALAGGLVGAGVGAAQGGKGIRADIQQEAEAEIIARIDRAQQAGRIAAQARQGRESAPEAPKVVKKEEEPAQPPEPPKGTGIKPPARKDPRILPTARRVADWYGKTYMDAKNAGAIEALASTAGERFRLIDIPVDLIEASKGTKGEVIESKVQEIAAKSEAELADLPPVIVIGGLGSRPLDTIDGTHRTLAAQQRGASTIRGYVPESLAQQIEAGTIGQAPPEGAVGPPAPPVEEEIPVEGAGRGERPEAGRRPDDEPKIDQAGPQATAERLGVVYNGPQLDAAGNVISQQYTDPTTGTTFSVKPGQDPRTALIESRKRMEAGQAQDPRVRNLESIARTAIEAGDIESMRSVQKRLTELQRAAQDPYGVSSPRAKDTLTRTRNLIDELEARITEVDIEAGGKAERAEPPTEEKDKPREQAPEEGREAERVEKSRAERAEEAVEREYDLARIDELTGIANLRAANEQMADLIERADTEGKALAVGGIDLILFKQVNDLLGHEAGDRALVAAAKSMEDSVRSGVDGRPGDVFGVVARLGGDEFEFALYDVTAEQAEMVGQRMQRAYVAAMEEQGVKLPGGLKTLLGFGFTIREPGVDTDIKQLRQAADKNLEARKGALKKAEGLPGREEAKKIVSKSTKPVKASAVVARPTDIEELVKTARKNNLPEEQIEKMRAELSGLEQQTDILSPVSTGQPTEVDAVRGVGRDASQSVLAEGVSENALGDGTYWAISESFARVFGPDIQKKTITLENPFVIESDKQLAEIAGVESIPLENKPRLPILRAARNRIEAMGHDGVIVNVRQSTDVAPDGGSVKRLREIFGSTTIIQFKKKGPTRAKDDTQPEAEAEVEAKVEPEGEPEEGTPEVEPNADLLEQDTGVPGAQLWFYPTDDAKIKAQQEKIRKEFERDPKRRPPPGPTKKKVPGPKKLPKPASNKPARLKAVSLITKDAPFERRHVFIDEGGKRLVTTDARTAVRITNESENWGKDGAHGIGKDGLKPAATESRFVKEILPKIDEMLAGYDKNAGAKTATLDVDEVANHLRRINILAEEMDDLSAMVMVNPDGTLGFAKGGKLGHAEINVKEGATELEFGIDPTRMLGTIEFINAMGAKTVEVFANNVSGKQPFIFRAMTPTRYVTSVIMPMKYTTPAKPESVADEAPGVAGAPMAVIPGDLSFEPASGRQKGKPPKRKPAAAEAPPVDTSSYTNDLNPLGAKEGAFRRSLADRPKKVKSAIARARARRDGGESLELDNIYKIISDLARRFGLGPPGLARQRILSRWAAGFYRIESEAIRLKRGSYVSTFVHELGHHLHKVMFARATRPSKNDLTARRMSKTISAYDFPKAWSKELQTLGKDLYGDRKPNVGGYATEGWAEVVRFLVTNPRHLKKRAPTVYQQVVQTLTTHHPEVWLALLDARVRLLNSVTIATNNPIDQFIAHDEPGRLASFSARNLWDDVRSRLFDRYQRLVTFKQDLGLGDLPAHLDPHTMALRVNGHISGDIKLMMERGRFDVADPAKRKTGKGLLEILEPIKNNLRIWQDYMVARRTLEKRGQGLHVLPQDQRLKDQTSSSQLREFIQRVEGTHPEFEQAAEEFQEFNRWLIGEYAVGHNLIDTKQALLIMVKNLEYITFRHKKTEDALQRKYAPTSRGGFTGRASGISRFREGFGEQLFPPLESFMASMQGIVGNARLNQVALGIINHVEKGTPGVGRWIDKRDRPMKSMRVTAQELGTEFMTQIGIGVTKDGEIVLPPYLENLSEDEQMNLVRALASLQGKTFWRPDNRTDRDNREVSVLRKGKPVFYEIKDARLFDLLEGLNNPAGTNLFVKVIGIPGRILRAGATQFNPSFFVPNFLRDLNQSLTMTESDMRKLPEQTRLRLKGMKQAFVGGDIHDLFLASGADMAGLFGEYYNPRTAKLDFEKMFEKPRLKGLIKGDNVKSAIRDIAKLGGIDRLNRAFELSNRLGEFAVTYEQSKRRGAPEFEAIAEAGQAAADITLDFQRGGTWSKQANEVIVFFNAAMLGVDKLGRFIKKSPMKAAGRIFTYSIVPSLISMLMNWDNDDYWSKPRGMRDRYWYFPTGSDDRGRPTYLKLPKPYGLGAFSIAAERSFALLFGIDPETGEPGGDRRAFEGIIHSLLSELRPTFNIAGLQPLIEVMAGDQGYSFYRDHEIVSSADKDLPLGEQGATRSSEFARIMGRWIDYPPAKIDYLIQGWTGGLGRDAVQVGIDPFIRAVDPDAKTGEPLEFDDWLIVRRFLASHTRSGHEAVTRFYDDFDRLKRINSGLKAREDSPKRYDLYARQYDSALALWPEYTSAHRRMSERFSEMRNLYRNRDQFDADLLDQRVTNLYDEIINTARETHQIRRRAEERRR